jgi:hypothetical protein
MIGKNVDASYADIVFFLRSFQITKMLQIAGAICDIGVPGSRSRQRLSHRLQSLRRRP